MTREEIEEIVEQKILQEQNNGTIEGMAMITQEEWADNMTKTDKTFNYLTILMDFLTKKKTQEQLIAEYGLQEASLVLTSIQSVGDLISKIK